MDARGRTAVARVPTTRLRGSAKARGRPDAKAVPAKATRAKAPAARARRHAATGSVVPARLVRGDRVRGNARPLAQCGDRPLHGRPLADGAGGGVLGLGIASRVLAGQAAAAVREGREEVAAPRQLRGAPRVQARRDHAVHRAAAAGSPLRPSGVAHAAVRRHLPVVPARAAVVVQRDDRRARRHAAARARRWRSARGNGSTWCRRPISC